MERWRREGEIHLSALLINTRGSEPNVTLDNSNFSGDELTEGALGYLRANCGHCHGGTKPPFGLSLWSTVGTSDERETPTFRDSRVSGSPALDPAALCASGLAAVSNWIDSLPPNLCDTL